MGIFSHLGIRFREDYFYPEKPDVLLELFRARQKEGSSPMPIQMAYHSVFIKMPAQSYKWWSPELTVNIEAHEKGSKIKKVTGPNPGTFTLAMFVIIGALVILFFALMFAFSQIQLNMSPLISLIVIAASIAVEVIVIAILGWGRKKAQPQLKQMNDFVKEVLSVHGN